MNQTFPAMAYLFLHDSCVDLYQKRILRATQQIPQGLLQLEHGAFPIITDYSDPQEGANCGILIASGYHHSDFTDAPRAPKMGLAFCVKDPHVITQLRNIVMVQEQDNKMLPIRSSFEIGDQRFILTSRVYDLDKEPCHELSSGEMYKKWVRPPVEAGKTPFD